jgi:hypothetical protein
MGMLMHLVLSAWLFSSPVFADAPRMTCNHVGEDDLRPGESPLFHYRDLELKRIYWMNMAIAAETTLRQRDAETYRFFEKNCEEKREELGAGLKVEYWSLKNGSMVSTEVTLAELARLKPTPGFAGPDRAFESDQVFEFWLQQSPRSKELDTRAAYASSKVSVIQECLKKTENGTSRDVPPHQELTVCHDHLWFDRWSMAQIGYRMKKEDGILVLEHSITLLYSGDASQRKEVISRVLAEKECVERFYANQGLRLKLTLKADPMLRDYADSDNVVVCVPEEHGRSDTGMWKVLAHIGPRLCSLMAHEIGHQLGLEDLYKDGCPAYVARDKEREVPMENVMSLGGGNMQMQDNTFEPWQAREIIAPLCAD